MSENYRFIKSWKTLRPGDKYKSDCFQGQICPNELLEAAQAAGVVELVKSPVTEDEWTAVEIKKAKKADLIEIIENDAELEVEGYQDMTVPALRDALISFYFPE